MEVKIDVYEKIDNDFYIKIGPFLGSYEIYKELCYPLIVYKESIWSVALVDNKVVGFGCLFKKGDKIYFENGYVLPEYRNQGIYKKLIAERIEYVKTNYRNIKIIMANCTLDSFHAYKQNGFEIVKEFKKIKQLQLNMDNLI